MKLAEALLLRKHLAAKVKTLEPIKINGEQGLFEVKFQRKPVNSDTSHAVDEIVAQVPKVSFKDFTKEYDLYASELRKLDGKIQEANWKFDVEYSQPESII